MTKGRTWRYRKRLKTRLMEYEGCEVCQADINLFKWAKNHGFNTKYCYLKPASFKITGRGMLATETLQKADVIISVPKSLLINTHYIMQTYIGEFLIRYNVKDLVPIQVICIFLMCEKAKQRSSFWEAYIASLPVSYSTPSCWSRDLVDLLPGWIAVRVKKQRQEVKSSFKKAVKLGDLLEECDSSLKGTFTYSNYLWAWNTVNTRAVYMLQEPHFQISPKEADTLTLVPVLDYLNHSCDVEIKAGFNYRNNCYEITSTKTYSKGTQVFINYGPHDNVTLLIEYGFILPNNPHSTVYFELDELLHSQICKTHLAEKLQVLSEQNLQHKLSCSFEGLSWNLQVVVMILSVHQFHLWKKCLVGNFVDEEHATLYKQVLIETLTRKKDLIRLPEKDKTNYHKLLVYEICCEQKAILEHCINAVK